MNEMLSIALSLVGLVVSLLTYIISFLENRKMSDICCNLQSTNITIKKRTHTGSDLSEILKYLDDILHNLYPKTKFKISIKIVVKNNTSSDPFVKTFITYYDNHINYSESVPIAINENFELSSILFEKKSFFFVSNIEEYSRLNANELGSYRFIPSVSLIVFPIKKTHSLDDKSIIGFLCLNSPKKLDNPKKNEILMKQLKDIASELYLPLQAAVSQLRNS